MDSTTLTLMLVVIALAAMANLGEEQRGWRTAAYAGMAALGGAVAALGFSFLVGARAPGVLPAGSPNARLGALAEVSPVRLGAWLLAGGILSCVALLPPVRRLVARVIPLRAESVVNAVALALVVLLLAQSVAAGGVGPQGFAALAGPLSPARVVLGEVPLALLALVGVGLYLRRAPRETWARLGLGALSLRQLGWTVLGLIGLLALQVALDAVASWLDPQALQQVGQATRTLYAGLRQPLAAALVSIASGVSEELLFRGAMQPRFGLIVTAVTFAVLHTQYGLLFAFASIGLVGIVLGIFRERINTTSCILIHTLYNFTLFVLAAA